MKKLSVQLTRCYLIQVLDEDGNEVSCEYAFMDRKDAVERGKELRAEAQAELEE